jgi:hypothetical protein
MPIVKLMIKYGADDWNNALSDACMGGDMVIVKLMIKYGANHLNIALGMACEYGHQDIAKFLILKCGATYCINTYCEKNIQGHLTAKNDGAS